MRFISGVQLKCVLSTWRDADASSARSRVDNENDIARNFAVNRLEIA